MAMSVGGRRRSLYPFPMTTPLDQTAYVHSAITGAINAAAIAVHSDLGPGFLESIYEEALCLELRKRGTPFERQFPIRVHYQDAFVGSYRLDLLVAGSVVVELKAIDRLEIEHAAVMMAYLKASNLQVGLILNFGEPSLRIRRLYRSPKLQ